MTFSGVAPHRLQPFQTGGRVIPYAFDHYHQVPPFHGVGTACLIVGRQVESPFLEPFHVELQSAVFHMQQLHGSPCPVDEDKDVSLAQAVPHMVLDHPAQRVHTLAHVRLPRAEEVAHAVIQAKHGRKGFGSAGSSPSRTAHRP